MGRLIFEWDAKKNRANQKKHGVSFEEAQTVFFDDHAVEFYDDEYDGVEDRFLLLGVSAKLRILLVCHCLREGGNQNSHHIRTQGYPKRTTRISMGEAMKKEYNLAKMKKRKNPYASRLKKQVTIRMGTDIVAYFKAMAAETGIPYQNLINLYLRDCAENRRKLNLKWAS